MGGFGFGRPGKRKTEDCWSLDVNQLQRNGCLEPGHSGHRHWTRNGDLVTTIGVRCEGDELAVNYWWQGAGQAGESIEYAVPLTWSPCTKGGSRPYFVCPGSRGGRRCGRRVAKLYRRGRYFLCRHCQGLCYASQSEARHVRLIRRRNKLMASLIPRGGEFDLEPPRPKGMWHRTYEARLTEIWRLEEEATVVFMGTLGEG